MFGITDFARWLFCLCAAATLGLCITTSSANSQIRSIVIGEGVRGPMYLPAYIAEEKGFFKRRELATKIVTFSRRNDINALVSGDIQFDLTAPDKVITPPSAGFR
jgi:ABC-type nitrate/sulfonate/bicarbonate transport system substrate-binding protein